MTANSKLFAILQRCLHAIFPHINSSEKFIRATVILFAAYLANGRISLRFFPQNFLPPPLSPSKIFFTTVFGSSNEFVT